MVSESPAYPPLVSLSSEDDYRKRFESVYCHEPVVTFDGIHVRFQRRVFGHAFFESTQGEKDNEFSWKRAERIDWIKVALQDPDSERYVGWDSSKKRYTCDRRVAIVKDDYVVVISLKKSGEADFITAFVADTPSRVGRPSTIQKIRMSPKWE